MLFSLELLVDPHVIAGINKAFVALLLIGIIAIRLATLTREMALEEQLPSSPLGDLQKRYFEKHDPINLLFLKRLGYFLVVLSLVGPFSFPSHAALLYHCMFYVLEFVVGFGFCLEGHGLLPKGTWRVVGTLTTCC
jgi:hypothetical protein